MYVCIYVCIYIFIYMCLYVGESDRSVSQPRPANRLCPGAQCARHDHVVAIQGKGSEGIKRLACLNPKP